MTEMENSPLKMLIGNLTRGLDIRKLIFDGLNNSYFSGEGWSVTHPVTVCVPRYQLEVSCLCEISLT